MQCSRCANITADSAVTCPKCGNPLGGAVDSYGATSFAPVLPAPQPAAHVSVRNATAPMDALGVASTMMSSSSPVPPTMVSNTPHSPPRAVVTPQPRYVVTPAQGSPQPQYMPPPPPTMQSAPPPRPLPSNPANPSSASPYAPPPSPMMGYPQPAYPMMMQQQAPMSQQQQGTPGLAVASLVCGLLGLVPLWIGFILCILAIIFAGIALSQTRPGQPGRGLAITGLVFGLVFILPAACGL